MKILFIDDEINILNSLRRLMRRYRQDWECEFCNDPFQAVELFTQQSYDLIVSDMRMPGMNGSKVLAEASRLQPGSIRVILSGYSEQDSFIEASKWCHIFMPKPYDEESIQSLLKRARVLKEMHLEQSEKQRLGGLSELPVLPEIYQEVDLLLGQEDFSAAQLGALITREPVMLAKIIQLANSAFFALPEPVASAEEAVVALGTDVIRGLVLNLGLLKSNRLIDESSHRLFLNRSLEIAAMAMQVADVAGGGRAEREAVFNAGMLNCLGKLVLLCEASMDTEQMRHYVNLAGQPQRIYETERGLCHSNDVTAYLLRLWSFPEGLIRLVTGEGLEQDNLSRNAPALWLHCAIAFSQPEPRPIDCLFSEGWLSPALSDGALRADIVEWYDQLVIQPA
ncbi:HDOD domain-containing protein [Marinobacterium jannaschii]|uniref:HDOD domain-containing protein n=1 Tax=Marinobacterium jannaschii TaxID=64970 RepID=UPI0004883445|nr:HDOD domain-containing protein [Marinobacterium jannaschii]